MSTQNSTPRRLLSRWAGWFFLANAGLFLLIGLSYIPVLPDFTASPLITTKGILLAGVFTVLAFVGQFALFAFASCAVLVLLILCFPRRGFAFVVGIVMAAAIALLLVTDSVVYHLYHFHFAGVIWHIIASGVAVQVLELSWVEWMIALTIALVLLLIEWGIAVFVWRRLLTSKPKAHGRFIGMSLVAALFLSYTMYLSVAYGARNLDEAKRSNDHLIVMVAQIVPYYEKILGLLIPEKQGFVNLMKANAGYFAQNKQLNKPLNYPLHPLQCKVPDKPLNIVVIAIDTWRFDMLNKKVSPHIAAFSKKAWRFKNHYSGGNCSRPGVFSIFYSIPGNYWTAVRSQKKSPVFIKQLLKAHYQMGIFGSASLHYPAFDKTIFRDIRNLQVEAPGDTPMKRDQKITQEFKQFISHRKKNQPFFSYVFYNEVHNWCGSLQPYSKPFQTAVKECDRLVLDKNTNPVSYLNRYRNAVHFVDQLVGKDLKVLKQQHLLNNTVVIITSDHGEEFNDEGLGYWGHASAYDPYQVKTPLIVYWPHQKHRVFTYKTSHYDIVPTLMTRVLNCKNPVSDYSSGVSLLTKGHRPYLIVGSYIDYAILKKGRVTTIYPGGNYAVRYSNGHESPKAKLDMKTLKKAFSDLNRYFK